jgi:hypothetical protein
LNDTMRGRRFAPLNVLAGILAVLCGGQVVTTLRDYQVCPREGARTVYQKVLRLCRLTTLIPYKIFFPRSTISPVRIRTGRKGAIVS